MPTEKTLKDYDASKDYKFIYLTQKQFEDHLESRNEHQRKAKLNLVSEAITFVRGPQDKTYDNIKDIRTSLDPSKRKVKLHYSRGTMLTNQGANVLKFSLAGSGFEHFRADYVSKKLKGNNLTPANLAKRFFKCIGHYLQFWKLWKPTFLSDGALREQKITEKFGEGNQIVDLKGRKLKKVRVKEQVKNSAKKVDINMAGSQMLGGLMNAGNYSMEKLREYVRFMGTKYLEPHLKDARDRKLDPSQLKLPVILKGHSRGAVSAVEGAMMLNRWVATNYPEYQDSVKFELTQYDPVPGADANKGVHHEVDHLGKTNLENDLMKPLGANAETTVMYSLHANHGEAFNPQVVKGAKRVIITPFEHSSGFKGADTSQRGEKHFRGYIDAKTGEVYRNSGLNELPEGVYMVDEMNHLIRMKDMKELQKVMYRITKNIPEGKRQDARYEAIKDAAESCFNRTKTLERSDLTQAVTQQQEAPAREKAPARTR